MRTAATDHSVHDRVLAFMRDPTTAPSFEALALEAFAHQYACIPPYRTVCRRRGRTPETVTDWRDIPPVPALAFKTVELRCAPAERTFQTSGTTQGQERRGRHAMPDLRLYHAAAVGGLKQFVFPDLGRVRILSLVVPLAERADSSLAQMIEWAMVEFGTADSASFATGATYDFSGFDAALRQSERGGVPVCIMATTGGVLRAVERWRNTGTSFRLPHGSRLMDTGGDKGAPRVLSRPGLVQAVWNALAIPGYFVVNEYGMTELSSQLYDNVIRDRCAGRGTHRAKAGPHWLRTRVLDPGSLSEAAPGATGLLCHTDLANAGTAVAVLTEDVGRCTADGLQVLGRVAGAEARGCSLALADFTERGARGVS